MHLFLIYGIGFVKPYEYVRYATILTFVAPLPSTPTHTTSPQYFLIFFILVLGERGTEGWDTTIFLLLPDPSCKFSWEVFNFYMSGFVESQNNRKCT